MTYGPDMVMGMASSLESSRARLLSLLTGSPTLWSRMKPKSVGSTKAMRLRGADPCELCSIDWRLLLLTYPFHKIFGFDTWYYRTIGERGYGKNLTSLTSVEFSATEEIYLCLHDVLGVRQKAMFWRNPLFICRV